MTIAEMLVAETGRMRAVHDAEGNYCFTREQAMNEAREIVAAIYGPPCEKFRITDDDFHRYTAQMRATGKATEIRPGDACRCGWPRSMHKEEKG